MLYTCTVHSTTLKRGQSAGNQPTVRGTKIVVKRWAGFGHTCTEWPLSVQGSSWMGIPSNSQKLFIYFWKTRKRACALNDELSNQNKCKWPIPSKHVTMVTLTQIVLHKKYMCIYTYMTVYICVHGRINDKHVTMLTIFSVVKVTGYK